MWQSNDDRRNAKTIAFFLFFGLILSDAIVAFYILREKINQNITEQALIASQARVIYVPLVLLQPEPPTPTPEPATPTPEVKTYTVQAGDTLFTIAHDHNVSLDELARVNQIQDVDMILIGQVLIIPEPAAIPTQKTEPNSKDP